MVRQRGEPYSRGGSDAEQIVAASRAPRGRERYRPPMVIEVAILQALPGQGDAMEAGLRTARAVISRATGYRDSTFHRGVEDRDLFVLYITWDSVEAHEVGFRGGPLFPEWRSHFGHVLTPKPDVAHYTVFAP
jgi:heme-degrading monooxygenase HmoA